MRLEDNINKYQYNRILNIEKSLNRDILSMDELNSLLEKGYTIVDANTLEKAEKDVSNLLKKEVLVNRGGKIFKQTVYVKRGEEQKEVKTPIGEELSPTVSGMNITKYSEKSLLITGDTYVNIDTLRSIKKEVGVGSWNGKLKGWIFPMTFLDKVLGFLWSDQIEKGNEEKAEAIKNQKNSSLEKGDEVNINGEKGEVKKNVSDSDGIKYNINLKDGTELKNVDEKVIDVTPEKNDKKISETINNSSAENRAKTEKKLYGIKSINDIHNYSLEEYMKMHGLSDEDIQGVVNSFKKKESGKAKKRVSSGGSGKKYTTPNQTEGLTKRQLIAKLVYRHFNAVKDAIERGEEVKQSVLDSYPSLDAEYKKKRQAMSEETKRKISEALKKNGAPEEELKKLKDLETKREIVDKERFAFYDKGREQDNYADKEVYNAKARSKGREVDKLDKQIRSQKNIVDAYSSGGGLTTEKDKVGVEYKNLPDFTKSDTSDIDFDIDNILTREKPKYIPEIDEESFRRNGYIFDVIKVSDDKYLLSTNGYKEFSEVHDGLNVKKGEYDAEAGGFVALTLDQLVLTQDYYATKEKAGFKEKAAKNNKRALDHWNAMSDKSKAYYLEQRGLYKKLPAKVKKEVSEEKWNSMSWQEREKHYKPIKKYGVERLKSKFDDSHMANSFHSMYERFKDPDAKRKDRNGKELKRGERSYGTSYAHADAWKSWQDFKETLDWKINDIRIQREELTEMRSKAIETSYGESNTNDSLVSSLGIKVKRQNGEDIQPKEIEQLKEAWVDVQKTFGSLKENAKSDNLKLSHAGKTYMFASKAIGVYVPKMKTIGVTAKLGEDQLGFTMGHEVAHWIDNTLGRESGRRFASDNYDSTAGRIANTFRKNMNKASKSNYINATHECFARAMQQYHAIESKGFDALDKGKDKYITAETYVSKEVYETKLKPLIKQFLDENKEFLKSVDFI